MGAAAAGRQRDGQGVDAGIPVEEAARRGRARHAGGPGSGEERACHLRQSVAAADFACPGTRRGDPSARASPRSRRCSRAGMAGHSATAQLRQWPTAALSPSSTTPTAGAWTTPSAREPAGSRRLRRAWTRSGMRIPTRMAHPGNEADVRKSAEESAGKALDARNVIARRNSREKGEAARPSARVTVRSDAPSARSSAIRSLSAAVR